MTTILSSLIESLPYAAMGAGIMLALTLIGCGALIAGAWITQCQNDRGLPKRRVR